jgi:hypothetical protein
VADDAVPVTASHEFATTLRKAGWHVEVVELDTDHGAIAGATYDSANDRYLPGDDPQTLDTAAEVADRIATAAS